MNKFVTVCAVAVSYAEASIFWQQLDNFLLDKNMETF